MWYKYATIPGIINFIPKKVRTYQYAKPILPPLHKQCKCKIIRKPSGKFEWITELNACKSCINSKIKFNLEQDALSEETSSVYMPEPIEPKITEQEPVGPKITEQEPVEPNDELEELNNVVQQLFRNKNVQ